MEQSLRCYARASYIEAADLVLCGAKFGVLRACFFLWGWDLVLCGAKFEVLRADFFLWGWDLVLYEAATEQNRVFRILLRSFFLFLDKGACGEGVWLKVAKLYSVDEPFYVLGKGERGEIWCLNAVCLVGELNQLPFGASWTDVQLVCLFFWKVIVAVRKSLKKYIQCYRDKARGEAALRGVENIVSNGGWVVVKAVFVGVGENLCFFLEAQFLFRMCIVAFQGKLNRCSTWWLVFLTSFVCF